MADQAVAEARAPDSILYLCRFRGFATTCTWPPSTRSEAPGLFWVRPMAATGFILPEQALPSALMHRG